VFHQQQGPNVHAYLFYYIPLIVSRDFGFEPLGIHMRVACGSVLAPNLLFHGHAGDFGSEHLISLLYVASIEHCLFEPETTIAATWPVGAPIETSGRQIAWIDSGALVATGSIGCRQIHLVFPGHQHGGGQNDRRILRGPVGHQSDSDHVDLQDLRMYVYERYLCLAG